jgi:flagellar hook-associated protein 1 FlgK
MSSLTSIMSSAASGLIANQTALRVVSDNVSNVNTPGYVRKVVNFEPLSVGDAGGVSVGVISRVIDGFLQQASVTAAGDAGQAGVQSDMLDRAQAFFGDPGADTAFFNQLDTVFQSFTSAASNAASRVQRNQSLSTINDFLNQSKSIGGNLNALGTEADSRAAADVGQINGLLTQISDLNASITSGTASGQDMSDAQNSQAQLIDQLSSLMDVTVTSGPNGRVDIRGGQAGYALVDSAGPATLSYVTTPGAPSQVMISQAGGQARSLAPAGGELQGLMDLRNTEIPSLSAQLGEYTTQAVDQINRAHNAFSAVPPPTTLTGRNTGLDLPTAVSGFTGKTTIAVTDASGVVQQRVDIDFDAGTMNVNGSATPINFTSASFLSSLNTALGSAGSASFANGALSLSATGSNGVAIADDPTTPSNKIGKGFSQFFGMNDLITSTGYPYAATGLKATDPNGFNAGGQVTMRLSDANGAPLKDVTVTVPAGGSMQDLLDSLNATSGGVGLYGQFSLDADGRMSFASSLPGVGMSVTGDTTQRGADGPAMSQLFGLATGVGAARSGGFSVRADISADGSKLAFAQFDTTAAVGSSALAIGDGRGALALAAVGNATAAFQKAGAAGAITTTLAQYAAQLSGSIAQQSASATARQANAETISNEADTRRSSVEGVNLDEELIKLTTYQQSYNASARMISAVSDMYDVLLNMGV